MLYSFNDFDANSQIFQNFFHLRLKQKVTDSL